jgi:phytoene/squalene synthetase
VAGRRTPGTVERAYRSWVATLGALSPRQKATVAQVYALAEQLDSAQGKGEPLSAVATVSRELRVTASELRDVGAVGLTPPAEAKPVDSVDQVALQRQQRRARAQAGGGPDTSGKG